MSATTVQVSRCKRVNYSTGNRHNYENYRSADAAYYPVESGEREFECNPVAETRQFPNYVRPRYEFPVSVPENNRGREQFQPLGYTTQRKFVEPLDMTGVNTPKCRDHLVDITYPGSNDGTSFWRDVLAIFGIIFIIKMIFKMMKKSGK